MEIHGDAKLISAAFIKARGEMSSTVIKDAKGNFGKYVTLAAIVEASTPAFAKYGLAIVQEAGRNEEGVTIDTWLIHESGATMHFGTLPMPVGDGKPQSVGSVITYGRRYALAGVCGLAPDDDDAQVAQNSTKQAQAQPRRVNDDTGEIVDGEVLFEKPKKQRASAEQIKELGVLGLQYYGEGWKTDLPKLCLAVSKGSTEDINELLPVECSNWIATIKKRIAAQAQEPIATVA